MYIHATMNVHKDESEDTITKSEMNIFKCDSQAYYIKPK